METIILLTIVLFLFYLIVSKKKNNFITSNTEENELNSKLKELIKSIEIKINQNQKKIVSDIVTDAEKQIDKTLNEEEEEESLTNKYEYKIKQNNIIYKEDPYENSDIYYTFKILNDKIYYSHIQEGCDRKNIVENLNNSYSLYSYVFNLLEQLLIYSNNNNNTTFSVINIDKFKRIKKDKKTNYIIEAIILNYKKYISHKYSFNIEIFDNTVNVKDISLVNSKLPLKYFTCDDSNHCSGMDSSLKIVDNIDNVDGVSDTELEYSVSSKDQIYNNTNINNIKDLKKHITLNNEYEKASFPCKTINHTWDVNGVSNSDEIKNNCFGSNYSLNKRNNNPFYHTSMFTNYNFEYPDVNLTENFKWHNMVGFDKT